MIFNMVGGGGGSAVNPTDAFLSVSAPLGSDITLTKSGVTLTPNFYASDSTHVYCYFIIKPNAFSADAWTVRAVRGSGSTQETAIKTLIINAAGQYTMSLLYELVLFDASLLQPDEMEALFRSQGNSKQKYLHGVSNYLGFQLASGTGSTNKWACITDIDLVNIRYNVLHFTAYALNTQSEMVVGLTTNSVATSSDVGAASFAVQTNASTSHTTIDLDISNISSVSHALIGINYNSNYSRTGYVSKIWATQGGSA